jgi:ubiquinol-cytochrome c reductase cytochrome c1 subunit
MKKLILTFVLLLTPVLGMAAGAEVHLEHAPVDPFNKESIKRGAEHFADYCYSCHSAEAWLRDKLIFTRDKEGKPTKVGELMHVAMSDDYAKDVFGTKVPDLSLTARARGADWVYTYLRSFYLDPYRPTGMNNAVFHDVSMPNVLWSLQGVQKAVYKTEKHPSEDGEISVEVLDKLEVVRPGSMTAEEFDQFAGDLTNFLVYLAEPVQAERRTLGWKVLLFLVVFFGFAYALKKDYWKDVH